MPNDSDFIGTAIDAVHRKHQQSLTKASSGAIRRMDSITNVGARRIRAKEIHTTFVQEAAVDVCRRGFMLSQMHPETAEAMRYITQKGVVSLGQEIDDFHHQLGW